MTAAPVAIRLQAPPVHAVRSASLAKLIALAVGLGVLVALLLAATVLMIAIWLRHAAG